MAKASETSEGRVRAAQRRVDARKQAATDPKLTPFQTLILEEIAVTDPDGYQAQPSTTRRLQAKGLVERIPHRPEEAYRLTNAGKAALIATGFDLPEWAFVSSAPMRDEPFFDSPAPSLRQHLPTIDYRGLRKPAEPVPEGGNVHRLKPRRRSPMTPPRPREDGAA